MLDPKKVGNLSVDWGDDSDDSDTDTSNEKSKGGKSESEIEEDYEEITDDDSNVGMED